MKKKLLIIVLAVITTLSLAMSVACSSDGEKQKKASGWKTDIENGSVYATVEYGSEYLLPDVYAVDSDGNSLEPIVTVKNPKGASIDVGFGIISLDAVGDWVVTLTNRGVDDFVYTVKCVDTIAPVISVRSTPSDIKFGETYDLPGFAYEDLAGIDNLKTTYQMFVDEGDGETEVPYDAFTRMFTVNKYGWYIFKTTAYDVNGNKTEFEKRLFVKDYGWTDNNLPEKYLATYDSEKYINTFAKGTTVNWVSNNTETYLPTYEGETGVVKCEIDYNSTGVGQALTKVRFPVENGIPKDQVGDVNIRLRIEQNYGEAELYFFPYSSDSDGSITYGNELKASNENLSFETNKWINLTIPASIFDRFAESDGNILGFQLGISRGKENPSLKVSVYFSAIVAVEILDTPENLRNDNGTAKWSAVANADGYRVVTGDSEQIITGTEYALGTFQGIVRVYAISNQPFYAESEQASMLVVETKAGEIASFDREEYCEGVRIVTPDILNQGHEQKLIGAYQLVDYKGETDVLKISIKTGVDKNNLGNRYVVVKIDLAKPFTANGYTVKHLIENTDYGTDKYDDNGRYFFTNADDTNRYAVYEGANVKTNGVWNTDYIDTGVEGSSIYVGFHQGHTANGSVDFDIYLSFVKEGINIPTKQGELASFDSVQYEGLVSIATPASEGRVQEAITESKYLATYEGETDVLKFTVSSGFDASTAFGHINNVIKIKLPKGHSAEGYTLKFMIESDYYSESAGTVWFTSAIRSDKYVEFTGENALTSGEWKEIYVPRNVSDNSIYIAHFVNRAGQTNSATYSMSLSWVKDGLTVEAEQGYLASFDSGLYEGMVSIATPASEGRVEEAITLSKYYATYEGEDSVLKFTVNSGKDANTAYGHINNVIKIKLPSGHGTSGYTLRFRLECDYYSASSGTLWFTSAQRSDHYKDFTGATALETNAWHTIYVPRSVADDSIYVALFVNRAGQIDSVSYSMALSWVKDGNTVG